MLVYRGEELETLAGFTTRMRSEFPSSEVITNFLVDQRNLHSLIGVVFFFA